MGNRNAIDGKLWGCFLAGLMLLFTCGLQGCKNSQSESPSRASRVVSPSGEEGSAEPLNPAVAGGSGLDAPSASAAGSEAAAPQESPHPDGEGFPGSSPARPSGAPILAPPSSMMPSHNAWGGSNTGLDMEVFGPGGTVVFRSHAYPFGERMERKNQKPSMTGTSDSQVQD